ALSAQTNAPHAHLRPLQNVHSAPSAWWQYAISVTVQRAEQSSFCTKRLFAMSGIRQRYMDRYRAFLASGEPPDRLPAEIAELDAQLPVEVALTFRCLVQAEVAPKMAGQQRQRRLTAPLWLTHAATRFADMRKRTASGVSRADTGAAAGDALLGGVEDTPMAPDEVQKLKEVFAFEEALEEAAPEHLDDSLLLAECQVVLDKVSLRLESLLEGQVLDAALVNIGGSCKLYPRAHEVALQVQSYCFNTPEGCLMQNAPPRHKGAAASFEAEDAAIHVVLRADLRASGTQRLADVRVAPGRVVLDSRSLQRLRVFVYPPTVMPHIDTSSLHTMVASELQGGRSSLEEAPEGGSSPKLQLSLLVTDLKVRVLGAAHSREKQGHQLVLHVSALTAERDSGDSEEAAGSEASTGSFSGGMVRVEGAGLSAGLYDTALGWEALEQTLPGHGRTSNGDGVGEAGVEWEAAAPAMPLLEPCNVGAELEMGGGSGNGDRERGSEVRMKLPMLGVHFSPQRVRILSGLAQSFGPPEIPEKVLATQPLLGIPISLGRATASPLMACEGASATSAREAKGLGWKEPRAV
ncbi:hypothetical protein CYMTET_36398, partial [Cymbomonas tetramitiformis]